MRKTISLATTTVPEVRLRDLYKFNNAGQSILVDSGEEVYNFLSDHITLEYERTMVLMTKTSFNIHSLSDNYFENIVNLGRINDISHINKFLELVNQKLPLGGHFVCCAETKNERKKRILQKYPAVISHIYYTFDFILKRIFPKLSLTKKLYMKITGGRNRVISKTEVLGRLYSCGFTLADEKSIRGKSYFVVRKTSLPCYDKNASYGMILKMYRFGKDNKIIGVYKFRTMHPFSEYLQQYVYEKNKLQEGGKFRNDFRISTMGKFMRKYWLDEIPMLYNLLKGDIKLVGVRPLSAQYLSLYDKEFRDKRQHFKPGLIPPFYADLPKTLEEIIDSERRYLEQYEKAPIRTDIKYLVKSCGHILFKKARSH
jgi:lipopolysaccharide/colanic/teichoic acid biosynthesis glycosyltransferase